MAYGIIYTLVEKYLNSEYPIQIIHEAGFVFLSYLHDFFSYYSLPSKFCANNTFSSKVTPNLVCPYSALFCSECGKMRTRITLNTDTFCAVQTTRNGRDLLMSFAQYLSNSAMLDVYIDI